MYFEVRSLQQWNLHDRVVAATTDQGSNMKKCMELFGRTSGVIWLPCASHCIQLAINKAWTEGGAEGLLDKCNNIAKIFKGKGAVSHHLKILQKDRQKPLTTQVKNDTRWNSRYEMLKRILDLNIYINMTVRHFNRYPSQLPSHIKLLHIKECALSQVEIDTLRELKDLMAPAAEFTNSIGSSAIPTSSLIYTTVRNLLPPLQNFNTTIAKAVHVALDQHIKRTWNLNKDSPAIDAILISMYLNPAILQDRIWDEPNGDSTHRTKAESLIITKIEEVMMKNRKGNVCLSATCVTKQARSSSSTKVR